MSYFVDYCVRPWIKYIYRLFCTDETAMKMYSIHWHRTWIWSYCSSFETVTYLHVLLRRLYDFFWNYHFYIILVCKKALKLLYHSTSCLNNHTAWTGECQFIRVSSYWLVNLWVVMGTLTRLKSVNWANKSLTFLVLIFLTIHLCHRIAVKWEMRMMHSTEEAPGEKRVIRYRHWRSWDTSCYDGSLSHWRWTHEHVRMRESVGWAHYKLSFTLFVAIFYRRRRLLFHQELSDPCFPMFTLRGVA